MSGNGLKELSRSEADTTGNMGMRENEIRQAMDEAVGAGGLRAEGDVMDRLAGRVYPLRQISAGPPDAKPKPAVDQEEIYELLERIDHELGLVALNTDTAARVHLGRIATQRAPGPES